MDIIKQQYSLSLPTAPAGFLSVKDFCLREILGQPYRLELTVTCPQGDFPLLENLGQPAVFSVSSANLPQLLNPIDRKWHGIIRGFEQNFTSADETVYRLTMAPRLDLLRDSFHCRGHLVDGSRSERGQGLELRTDGWGAIRAAKGLFLSADIRPEAMGKQLDMREASMALNNVVGQAKGLEQAAKPAKTPEMPTTELEKLVKDLTNLKKPGLVLNAPDGLALASEGELLMTTAKSLTLSVAKEIDLSTATNLTMTAAKGVSLFAQNTGAIAAAATKDLIIQAQTDKLNMAADQDLFLRTAEGEIIVAAGKEVVLSCGKAYIKIKGGDIELGCPGQITSKCATWTLQGAASLSPDMPVLPKPKPL